MTIKQKVLVSIVSDQTIPNYLFIKEFQNKIDKFVFISTKNMEEKNKTQIICSTAIISKKNRLKTLVEEDTLYLIDKKLENLNLTKDADYLVNLTGGTKLMSNAVFEYFKGFDSRFFYLPIGKNIIKEIFPNQPAKIYPIQYKTTLKEYLKLHDIDFKEEELPLNETKTDRLYDLYKRNNFENFPFFLITGFNLNNQQKYALWFELYLFYKLKRFLSLNEEQIKTGIKLFKREKENNFSDELTDNEIDIVFILNNNCYIIEAKVSVGKKKVNTTAITNYMYKLAAVNKRFGLNAKAVLMLFADLSKLSIISYNNLQKRSKILNLPFPFDRQDIVNDERFKNKLLTFLK